MTMVRAGLFLTGLVGLAMLAAGCRISINGGYSFDYRGAKSERNEIGSIDPVVKKIVIENRFGDIQIQEQDDEAGWSWTGACWATDIQDADRFLEDLTLEVAQNGQVQTWTVDMPPSNYGLRGVQSDLVIKVPASVEVVTTNRHGDTEVQGISGPVFVTNQHGHVNTNRLTGEVKIECQHGHVKAAGLSSLVELEVQHGNTSVSDAQGPLKIKSHHGDVTLNSVTAKVDAQLRHGNLKGDSVAGDVRFDSRHGRVELQLVGDEFSSIEGKAAHSGVKIILPSGCVPRVDTKLRHGRFRSDVETDTNSDKLIRVDASHTNVQVSTRK